MASSKSGTASPARERGQAIIECVVFAFFAMAIAVAACEAAKYAFAQASVEAAATEAARAYAANPNASTDSIKETVFAASPNLKNATITKRMGNPEVEKYQHKLANGSGDDYISRDSYVSTEKFMVVVSMECSYVSGIGKIMNLGGGRDTYTVTAYHALDIDSTAVAGDGASEW